MLSMSKRRNMLAFLCGQFITVHKFTSFINQNQGFLKPLPLAQGPTVWNLLSSQSLGLFREEQQHEK